MQNLSRNQMRVPALIVGALAALIVITSQELTGSSVLDIVGKIVFWTGAVFLPLFGLNLDLAQNHSAQAAALIAIVVHAALMWLAYSHMQGLNFILITPLAIIEMLILAIPFIRLRQRIDAKS